MNRTAWNLLLSLLLVLVCTACGGDDSTPTPDTVTPDTVTPDTATPDTVTPDTATPDTATPDVPCTPTCGLSECGDDGCGGVCGTCSDDKVCADGSCVVDNTSPCGECPEGTVCGANPLAPNACSGPECGDVTFEGTCQDNMLLYCDNDELFALHCETNEFKKICDPDTPIGANCVCTPQCDGKEPCADDECGGICETCSDDFACNDDGLCADPCGTCPEGTTCGFHPGSPNYCGSDTCGTITYEGECQGDTVLYCDDNLLYAVNCKEWMNATANSTCGFIDSEDYYDCTCTPDCSGDPCGDDGCGGTCEGCPEGQNCSEGICCTPDCSGDPCGDNGCGGTCNACEAGKFCEEGQCESFATTTGNTCAVPFNIEALPFEGTGDTNTFQNAYQVGAACSGMDPGTVIGEVTPDTVYRYTPTESGVHTVTLTGFATIVTVTTDCATLETGCTKYSGDLYMDESFEVTLTAETPYYFIVDGLYGDDAGTYTFSMVFGSACTPACEGKSCGDDGCGSVCGTCVEEKICNTEGQCVDDTIPPIPGNGVDLSGYVITQTDSDKTFTIPEGTVVAVGGTVVIGRKAEKADFANFWGVTDTTGMVYFNANDKFPTINGDETYTITNAKGITQDGPTLVVGKYFNYQRKSVNGPASEESAWVSTSIKDGSKTLAGVATPGSTDLAGPSKLPVVVSEISDANGNGAYYYEFVELAVLSD